jgi:hypothetical protein
MMECQQLNEQKQDPAEPLLVHEDTGSAPFIAINKQRTKRIKPKKRKK